ncbi:MAG: hypothetical protein JNJ83_18765 [Verrucomicrobiaceae bacterium]|nr:hypothetical protein [Verrucomicrobiaceae bacterium]
MRHILFTAVLLRLCVSGTSAIGQEKEPTPPPIPPSAIPDVVQKLREFQTSYEGYRKEILQSYIERFRSAAASEQAALNFHSLCVQAAANRIETPEEKGRQKPASPMELIARLRQERAENQDGGRGGRRKGDDKKDDEKSSQNTSEQTAIPGKGAFLQLQLEYLNFTIEAPTYQDKSAIPGKFKDFIERGIQLASRYLPPGTPAEADLAKLTDRQRQELQERQRYRQSIIKEFGSALTQDVYASAFAKAGGVETHFKKEPKWPAGPLSIKAIYENFILPPVRTNNIERVSPAWDEYIAYEAAVQRAVQDETGYARWTANDLKDLEFQKWLDVLLYSPNRDIGLNEIINLCKNNPQHPKLGQWISQMASLEKQLSKPSTATAPTENAAEPK